MTEKQETSKREGYYSRLAREGGDTEMYYLTLAHNAKEISLYEWFDRALKWADKVLNSK